MKMLGWIIAAALVLFALFGVANWTLLTAPATLNFLAFTVQGPLGLILLGATIAFVALFAIYALSMRTSALVETRRHMKEIEAQRELADRAEASRFTALGTQLEQAFERMRAAIEDSRAETLRRSDALEQSLVKTLDETANALYANVGEVDDKLDRIAARIDSASGARPG